MRRGKKRDPIWVTLLVWSFIISMAVGIFIISNVGSDIGDVERKQLKIGFALLAAPIFILAAIPLLPMKPYSGEKIPFKIRLLQILVSFCVWIGLGGIIIAMYNYRLEGVNTLCYIGAIIFHAALIGVLIIIVCMKKTTKQEHEKFLEKNHQLQYIEDQENQLEEIHITEAEVELYEDQKNRKD